MKNIFKTLYAFLGITLLFTACTPKEYELGALLDKGTLKFTVAPSSANPNDIVLTSLTPNLTPLWITPFGTSIKGKDTVNIAFPGTYKFVYGVESDGGLVQADTTLVTVNTLDQNALKDPMWVNLTGGYGKSKTWVLDVDANGLSKYFNGPMYFAGFDYSWEWDAGWADWIMPKGDYGTMTFDLIGDAHFKSDNKMLPNLSGTGKFMLYPDKKQLATFGAQVIHDGLKGAEVLNWYAKMAIKSLDANHMQLVAVTSGGWSIYNYISKEYYDSH